jgi:glycosyltransferase involved in cell wall biosynthesis
MGSKDLKLAICVNHYAPSVGGCELVSQQIAEFFSNDHEVFVITRRLKGRNHSKFKNYKVIEYTTGDQRSFMAMLQKLAVDVVFVYSDVFDFFRHLVTDKHSKHRLILALCGANWIHDNRTFANILFRHADKIDKFVCHSDVDRDYKLCKNPRLFPKTVVIPNGIDLAEFDSNQISREELIEKHGLKRDWLSKKWVLNISNFFPGKGQEYQFPILERIDGDFVYFQICSDIPFPIGLQLENKWKVLASKSKITTKLLKNIPRKDVVAFFKQSSVFSFTSEKEVAPLVLLESMAAGVPWVATDVGNALSLKGGDCIRAVKNRNGYSLFDTRVYRLFAQSLTNVWGRAVFAEPGRKQIERDMTWDKILPQYASIIER